MQIIQAKCLQVNFQPYVVMEANSHHYSGFTEVKEQALPCPGNSLADAQPECHQWGRDANSTTGPGGADITEV